MKNAPRLLLVAGLLLIAAGCGDDAPSSGTTGAASKQDRTKRALEALFADVRAGDHAAAARRVVYRGKDLQRKWKSVCDYGNAEEKRQVDRFCTRLRDWLGDGPVDFVEFQTRADREGEWLAWTVKLPKATALFACLDLDGTIAVGDVDRQ